MLRPHTQSDLFSEDSLEKKQKELIAQKEALLKISKAKSATSDNVKTQIDLLMKVRAIYLSSFK